VKNVSETEAAAKPPYLALKPTKYFKPQGTTAFTDDEVGLADRNIIGVNCLLWGNNYPHHESTFPHSRAVIERGFRNVRKAERKIILQDNILHGNFEI